MKNRFVLFISILLIGSWAYAQNPVVVPQKVVPTTIKVEFSGKVKEFVLAADRFSGWPVTEDTTHNKWNWKEGVAGPLKDYQANWNRVQIRGVWFNPITREVFVAFPSKPKTIESKKTLSKVFLEFSKTPMQQVIFTGKSIPKLSVSIWVAKLPAETKKFQFSMVPEGVDANVRWG